MTGIWVWALPLLPVATGGLLLAAGRRLDRVAAVLATGVAVILPPLAALLWRADAASAPAWLPLDGGAVPLGLAAGGVNGTLAVLIAGMGLAVLVYSVGHMGQEAGRARFFGWMSLFLGGMELVALAPDLLTLLIGWELVGLCSYALIGFRHREPERTTAAQRAFLATRTADLGLWLAAMTAFSAAGGFALERLPGAPDRDLIAAGLILAAAGKSAQLPFSGWLSGAMLGPSPVSALLHSAAMVAAGVMLLLKALPLLAAVGWAAPLLLWLGVATALLGAVVAMHQDDLKQLLAASTVSQMGYLFAGLGALAGAAVATHLINHAAFKALLFLVAGVLLRQGMRRLDGMGGLRRRLPLTALAVLLGVMALAPLPPLGGFFSKEAILGSVHRADPLGYYVLLGVAPLTAAYAGYLYLAAFGGGARTGEAERARRPSPWELLPMLALGLLALVLALLAFPPLRGGLAAASGLPPIHAFAPGELLLAAALGLAGLLWAGYRQRYGRWLGAGEGVARAAHRWLGSVALLDALGTAAIRLAQGATALGRLLPLAAVAVAITRRAARAVATLDRGALDAWLLGGSVALSRGAARASRGGDRRLLDGALQALTRGLQAAAGRLSGLQSGLLYSYYAQLTLGVLLLCAWLWALL